MALTSLEGLALPQTWQTSLAGYQCQRQTIGRSSHQVFKLEAANKPTFFIKTGPQLEREAECLAWLNQQEVPSARLVDFHIQDDRQWLLMGAVNGRSLAESPELVPESIIEITADALRSLHACPVAECPFEYALAAQTPAATEALVVTHGDPCLPNLLADQGRFSGFIDCGQLACADRHRDIAQGAWSIGYNLGEQWVTPFLRLYGQVDEERLALYTRLEGLA